MLVCSAAAAPFMRRAEQCAVLWFAELNERRLYRDLEFSSMHQYAYESLKFSKSKFYQFMNMAKLLEQLPAVEEREL